VRGKSAFLGVFVAVGVLVAVTIPAVAAPKPDLVVTAVTVSTASVSQGTTFTAGDTTKNIGAARAGASTTSYYLSTDKLRTAGDTKMSPARAVARLAPSKSSKGTKLLTISPTMALGQYYVLACADSAKKVAESKEGNNCRSSLAKLTVTPPPDVTAPDAPVINRFSPASGSYSTAPFLLGVAEPGSTVKIYPSADCTGADPYITTAAASDGEFMVQVEVEPTTTTPFTATARDAAGNTSACSAPKSYENDINGPEMPTLTGFTPTSPGKDLTPMLEGEALPDSLVGIYRNAICGGVPLAMIEADDITGVFTAPVVVNANGPTTFYASAEDDDGHLSQCSAGMTYTHDGIAPDPPQLNDLQPSSGVFGDGADDNDPRVFVYVGEPGSVEVFGDPTCSGAPLGTGPAAPGDVSQLQFHVEDDTQTPVYLTLTDQAGNVSECNSGRYVNDPSEALPAYIYKEVTPLADPFILGSDPVSPTNGSDRTPIISGETDPGATVTLHQGTNCFSPVVNTDVADAQGEWSIAVATALPANSSTPFMARAQDGAEQSNCVGTAPATPFNFVHDTIAPTGTPTFQGSSPQSPSQSISVSLFGNLPEFPVTTELFTNSACTGAPFASKFDTGNGFFISLDVPENATTTFYARMVDEAGNIGPCSGTVGGPNSSFTYVNDTLDPTAPVLTGTVPVSGSADTTPVINGTVEPGAFVYLFKSSNCGEFFQAVGNTTANGSGEFSIPATVPRASTTTFTAKAIDEVGNTSPCSGAITYVETTPLPACGPLFADDFSDNSAGWTLDTGWEIGPATASSGHAVGNPDPADDHSPTADDGVLGVDIGGNAPNNSFFGPAFATSPVIDTGTASGTIKLDFWRWHNNDAFRGYMNMIQVGSGGNWTTVFTDSNIQFTDMIWTPHQSIDVTAYKNQNFQVRIGFYTDAAIPHSSWNIDDLSVTCTP
jgi:CARDB/Bacterial Ig domain